VYLLKITVVLRYLRVQRYAVERAAKAQNNVSTHAGGRDDTSANDSERQIRKKVHNGLDTAAHPGFAIDLA
jgi:hypothetical protein